MSVPLTVLLSLLLVCTCTGSRTPQTCTTCKFPQHSWDTVPVSFHSAQQLTDSSGGFSQDNLDIISKFPLVTIEKWQGVKAEDSSNKSVFLWEEDAMIKAAKQIKAINENISVIVWFDTMLIYTGWNMSGTGLNTTLNPDIDSACATGHFRPAEFLEKHEQYLLKNTSGLPALEPWSHCHIYDHSKDFVRQYWTDMCLNMTATGVIDGCGADFSAMEQNSWKAHTVPKIAQELGLDNATATAWAAGHRQMMKDTTAALGNGLLVAKDGLELGDHANGVLHEGCQAVNDTVFTLQNLTARAKAAGNPKWVYQCHGEGQINALAAFLIGAGDGHYFSCGGWNDGADGHWIDDLFSKPLGAPLGDGVYDASKGCWTRSFAKGTKVTLFPANRTGFIDWGQW
eukprot:m.21213 g.21213  ORF g.21213 m.21213 type:complete len:398 (-) comp7079_c0_seq2:77-1270(-)